MSVWTTVRLGDIAVFDRSTVAPESIQSGSLYVGLENIESGGKFKDVRVVQSGDLASSKFSFTPRHILYGKLRPYLAKVALPEFSGICSTDVIPIAPRSGVDRRFLAHYLRHPDVVELAAKRSSGANLPRISPKTLAQFDVPLPPFAEQKLIAATLDAAEALREKRQRSVDTARALVQAIFIDLFGDPVMNSGGWPVKKLADVGTLDRGVSKHRPRNAPELLGGPHPLVQTGDVANSDGYIRTYSSSYSDVGLRQSKLWPAGTLCITIAANIGKVAILTFEACFPDSVVGFITENHATVEYVRVWFSFLQKSLEENAPESAQKNINLAILRDLDIPLPPGHLREDFGRRVAAVKRTAMAQRASVAKLDDLFASLQHRAFRGEL